jgi:predicted DCC family thiol-disulfide oxidoreductase YuxK
MSEKTKLTVWYNTKCPVCNAGIDWQRHRLVQAVRAGAIEFRDINDEPDALPGIDIEAVRRRLHGRDAAGTLFVGADCAIEIWARTPGDGWLAWLGRRCRPVANWGYDRFAGVLYGWNRRRGHW